MDNLELLKGELISQKTEIEAKGGTVHVSNTNPSPHEITTGISTIPSTDFTTVTATEQDVTSGKYFYNNNGVLVSGTSTSMSLDRFKELVLYGTTDTGSAVYYTFPANTTYVRQYMFYGFPSELHVTFDPATQEIGSYCLDETLNATVENFSSLSNLRVIGASSFRGCHGLDTSNIPNSVTTIGTKAFQDAMADNTGIRIGPNVTSLGQYAFANYYGKVRLDTLQLGLALGLTSLPSFAFQNLIFSGDFITPDNITSLSANLAYGGDFGNIYINSHITSIGSSAFNCSSSDASSLHTCSAVEFYGNTPPTIGTTFLATKLLRAGFHIFVPDNAFDNYYSLSALSTYKSYITRASERG